MFDKPMLSLDQIQKAMNVMMAKATEDSDRPLAIAIVDDVGDLISYVRMDRCRKIPQRMAIRKAYTCALSGQDSKDYAARLKEQGRSVAEMGDPMLAAVQGGVVVLHPSTGAILGGIGVSGLAAQEDEDIAERVVRERKRSARVQHCACEGGQTDPYDGPAADPDQIRAHEQRRGEHGPHTAFHGRRREDAGLGDPWRPDTVRGITPAHEVIIVVREVGPDLNQSRADQRGERRPNGEHAVVCSQGGPHHHGRQCRG